jgi:nicotinamide mononucleotide transporter
MQTFIDIFWKGVVQTTVLEWIAVSTSIIYVILASKRMILCWVFALISSGLYVYICYFSQLYIETFLQLFYVVMGILGWIFWKQSKNESEEIKTWGFRFNSINCLLSGGVAFALGLYFDVYTDQASPYLDATVTSFALSATWMITKKVHEGWIYLLVVDLLSIYLYATRELYLTSLLSLIYAIMAYFGWNAWIQKRRKDLFSA